MRALLRCVFHALTSSGNSRTVNLFDAARSAQKITPKTLTACKATVVPSLKQFSPFQQRFYSSGDAKKALEQRLLPLAEADLKKAVQMLNDMQEKFGNSPDILFYKAHRLSQLGYTDEALELSDQLAAMDSGSASCLRGIIYGKMGKFESAIEYLEEARKKFPNSYGLLVDLGSVYYRMGRLSEALEAYQRAYNINPYDWQVIVNLYVCCKRLPQFNIHAVSISCSAVALFPEKFEAWNNLAEIYRDIGEYDKAEECFNKMQSIDSNLSRGSFNHANLLLQMNKIDKAEKMYLKVINLKDNEFAYSARTRLIKIYSAQNRYEEVKALAEQLTKSDPFQSFAWYQLGLLHMNVNVDEAIKYFEHALSLDSEEQNVLDGLACCHFIKGQYDTAVAYFKRTNKFAISLASCQMFGEAKSAIEFLLKKFPERANDIYNAQLLLNAFKRDYVAEFESYKKKLETSADPIDRANFFLLNNDFDGALTEVDRVLATDPKLCNAIVTQAIILMEGGYITEAALLLSDYVPENSDLVSYTEVFVSILSREDNLLGLAEKICQQFPSLYASRMAMSEVHRRRGNHEQALHSWRTSQKINSRLPENIFPSSFPYRYLAHQQLGKILESMGDVEGAMKEYNFVLSINPLDLFSKQRLDALRAK